jgi:NAD(P)-dependent dehydrogenase (short-subunit alcohol dehydrogenase family)
MMNDELGDLRGRVAIVTGANSGIGFETALALAGAGAHVILAGRSQPTLDRAVATLRSRHPQASAATAILDLADLSSVRAFADTVRRSHPALHLLINNAGVMAIPERRLTVDGFELTFGTNHLGHFALTGLLLPQLTVGKARVVTVSALVARRGQIQFDNLDWHSGYAPMKAYAASKLANVAFAVELAKRGQGVVTSVAVHPGTALTGLQQHSSRLAQAVAKRILEPLIGHSPIEAARPTLYAATSVAVTNGGFYGPTGRFELRGRPGPVTLPKNATDSSFRSRLWIVSEDLTNVHYNFTAAAVATEPSDTIH